MGCAPSNITAPNCHLRVLPMKINAIDEEIQKEALLYKDTIKILLLGEGDSGKSTIAKQMRILHSNGYSLEDLKKFRDVVHSNTIEGLTTIITAMRKLEINFDGQTASENAKLFCAESKTSNDKQITPELGSLMKSLWHDGGVQKCYMRSNEYQLIDSAAYYLNNLDVISMPSYIPDEQDVLRARVRTLGIVETRFNLKNLRFRLVDVGGQRAHRRKWIHCFDDVAAMIFCVALSGYDLVLEEDRKTNRMHESLALFKAMYTNKWFVKTAIILLLNKRDIFQKKIQNRAITSCFPEYSGGNTYEETTAYIKERFEEIRWRKDRSSPTQAERGNNQKIIYTHFTCATDTPSIDEVFDAISDVAIQNSFTEMGLF